MSRTYTYSESFTRTHARYLASKVAADLRQMRLFYGQPSDDQISNFVEELTELLAGGYLESVDYGFRRNDGWTVALHYKVLSDGTLDTDDRAGRVPIGADVSGASWYSFLRHSAKWSLLTQAERERIENSIPVKRGHSTEPIVGAGIWSQDKIYSSNGTSFTRLTLKL
ncbi:MAG TPA: hypothetical protein PKA76_15375 [Pirellulaceae bacterium]|nr:hypothetical protein [Pyrinomonadaceae bacterium]HMP65568.1 hypothetical protein [Pyrinomonadaceae bacterium]HMP70726.1 hypothetical protein [Pirellulaceae bacterium]